MASSGIASCCVAGRAVSQSLAPLRASTVVVEVDDGEEVAREVFLPMFSDALVDAVRERSSGLFARLSGDVLRIEADGV